MNTRQRQANTNQPKSKAIAFVVNLLGITMTVLVLLALLLPSIASLRWAQELILPRVLPAGHQLKIESAKFSWIATQKITAVQYRTNDHVLQINSIEVNEGLFTIARLWLTNHLSLVPITIDQLNYDNQSLPINIDVQSATLRKQDNNKFSLLEAQGQVGIANTTSVLDLTGKIRATDQHVDISINSEDIAISRIIALQSIPNHRWLFEHVVGRNVSCFVKFTGKLDKFTLDTTLSSNRLNLNAVAKRRDKNITLNVKSKLVTLDAAVVLNESGVIFSSPLTAQIVFTQKQLAALKQQVDQQGEVEVHGPIRIDVDVNSLVYQENEITKLSANTKISGIRISKKKDPSTNLVIEPIVILAEKLTPDQSVAVTVKTGFANQIDNSLVLSFDESGQKVIIKDFPTTVINQVIDVFGAAKVVDDILGESFNASFRRSTNKRYALSITAAHLNTQVEAKQHDDHVSLTKDARVAIKPSGLVQDYLFVWILPFLSAGVSGDKDASLVINKQGARLPIPFNSKDIVIQKGTLNLGVVRTLPRGPLAQIIRDLDLITQEDMTDMQLEFSPVNFSVKDGVIRVEPFTITIDDKHKITVNGSSNIERQVASFFVTLNGKAILLEGPLGNVKLQKPVLSKNPTAADEAIADFGKVQRLMPQISSQASSDEKNMQDKGQWTFTLHVGASANYDYKNKENTVLGGSQFFLGGLIQAGLDYKFRAHIFSSNLSINEEMRSHPNKPRHVIKSQDRLQLDALYLYLLTDNFGVFAEAIARSSLLASYQYISPDINLQDKDGTELRPASGADYIRLSDPFFPLVLQQNAGVITRPFISAPLLLEGRAGLGFRQTIAAHQKAVKRDDSNKKKLVIRSLENAFELGPMIEATLSGVLLFKRLSYQIGAFAMWPALNFSASQNLSFKSFFDAINVGTFATVNLSILEFASIESRSTLERYPRLSNDWQWHTSLFTLFSYSF